LEIPAKGEIYQCQAQMRQEREDDPSSHDFDSSMLQNGPESHQ
jgi:hypothetical protein